LVFAAFAGVNTVNGKWNVSAATASARPWLPADAVTRAWGPPARSRRASTALKAPRDLKEFETCTDSTLIDTRVPVASESHGE
jgi:hypothetical protein